MAALSLWLIGEYARGTVLAISTQRQTVPCPLESARRTLAGNAPSRRFLREDHAALDFDAFVDAGTWVVPVEDKQDSFGWYQGRIVAIDYGD